ncbi:uncharacterized protein CLUP02_09996 [Colletotrichum lupini]|uniref:Uncharacterized protein n=1 Tax=Colletotrichum lupini TaxID=145971 RepID=A0A9Q8SVX0_9PEZI|nr:uncharacterized protein CLUP02_09996 [Colletotrichum lupini]UQC84499.1 hypothetical protein CLUP02_09996 [Colletotrichum lupini]
MEARRQSDVCEIEARARLYVGETEKRPTLQAVYVDVGWTMIVCYFVYVRTKVETVETAHIKADKTFRLLVEEQLGQGRMEEQLVQSRASLSWYCRSNQWMLTPELRHKQTDTGGAVPRDYVPFTRFSGLSEECKAAEGSRPSSTPGTSGAIRKEKTRLGVNICTEYTEYMYMHRDVGRKLMKSNRLSPSTQQVIYQADAYAYSYRPSVAPPNLPEAVFPKTIFPNTDSQSPLADFKVDYPSSWNPAPSIISRLVHLDRISDVDTKTPFTNHPSTHSQTQTKYTKPAHSDSNSFPNTSCLTPKIQILFEFITARQHDDNGDILETVVDGQVHSVRSACLSSSPHVAVVVTAKLSVVTGGGGGEEPLTPPHLLNRGPMDSGPATRPKTKAAKPSEYDSARGMSRGVSHSVAARSRTGPEHHAVSPARRAVVARGVGPPYSSSSPFRVPSLPAETRDAESETFLLRKTFRRTLFYPARGYRVGPAIEI